MKDRLIDLLLSKELITTVISSGVAVISALGGILVQSYIERKRRKEDLYSEDKKNIYAKILSSIRCVINPPDPDLLREAVVNLSEGILFSTGSLRAKLIKAGNSLPNLWQEKYGMEKTSALKDLEMEMKKDLGIDHKEDQ